MATMASCCGHVSSHRRISQSHITSLARITCSWEMPPTSSTATGTIQRNFPSQFHASTTSNTNCGSPGNHTPTASDGLWIWVSVGSEEEKDLPQSKNEICASVHGFSDHLDHHWVWSCVKGRTHSLSWVWILYHLSSLLRGFWGQHIGLHNSRPLADHFRLAQRSHTSYIWTY